VKDDSISRLRYYNDQGRQHLNRVRLSHRLALDTVQHAPLLWEGKYAELIRGSFPNVRREEYILKVSNGLHEVHLVSLKSNFELFLNRILSTVWQFHFVELIGSISESAMRKITRNIKNNGESEHDVQNIIDEVVPQHGLKRFDEELNNATRVLSPHGLDMKGIPYWPQIFIAFEVRHLVEHRDGKVDHKFRRKVDPFWPQSSWGKRLRIDRLRKVDVQEEDVVETCSAMCEASNLITAELVRWSSERT